MHACDQVTSKTIKGCGGASKEEGRAAWAGGRGGVMLCYGQGWFFGLEDGGSTGVVRVGKVDYGF
jgi:hypothetical protein